MSSFDFSPSFPLPRVSMEKGGGESLKKNKGSRHLNLRSFVFGHLVDFSKSAAPRRNIYREPDLL